MKAIRQQVYDALINTDYNTLARLNQEGINWRQIAPNRRSIVHWLVFLERAGQINGNKATDLLKFLKLVQGVSIDPLESFHGIRLIN